MSSLFEQIGGEQAMAAAVNLFYQKVLADENINHFFAGVDMQRQGRMQKNFLTFAFGGPQNYEGKALRGVHAKLVEKGLNDSHFDAVVTHLGATLKELGVAEALIQQVAAVANTVRNDVLCK